MSNNRMRLAEEFQVVNPLMLKNRIIADNGVDSKHLWDSR
jgi:hypothetical protein